MGTMLDTIENAIIPEQEAETEVQPGTAQPVDGIIETQLTQEITALWSDHVRLSTSRKATAKELRQIRASLAERLHEMKCLLSRPGRLGQWRGWLRQQGIPRSTADRLASRHAETLGIENGNVPSGAIPEPAKPTAEKLAETVWPSLKKVLTTGESVVEFIGCIAEVSGVPHEWREIGLMIFYPVPEAADGLPGSAVASPPTGSASQPSDEASAITEEPGEEIPATAAAAGETAAATSNGDVQ